MSRIKGKDTGPEVHLRSVLHKSGLRFRKNVKDLHGKPDILFSKARVAVFVDGCFWHGHDCGKNVSPKTNAKAWREKIARNKKRDRRVNRLLRKDGWTVIRIWECTLAKWPDRCINRIQTAIGAVR